MTIGKTSSSITASELLSKFSEAQVLATIFPQVASIPCLICSPLRPDRHPSFYIYQSDGGHVRYKDFADNSEYGGLFDLLCKYWKCTFKQALTKVSEIFIEKKHVNIKTGNIRVLTRKESSELTKVQVVVRPWRDYDYEYWESYGIERKWLKWAEIRPISYKIVTKWEKVGEKGKKYIFPADKYAYCFVERKEGKLSLKVYQPYNTGGFKWCSQMDASIIGLWTKIPETGEKVIICSSLKDALCISSQLNIPAICLQGEGYDMSDTAIKELKRRYKKIFISFDTDKAGVADSIKLSERTGFINVIPDLGKEKDYSDYYKSLENKEEFQKLRELFL